MDKEKQLEEAYALFWAAAKTYDKAWQHAFWVLCVSEVPLEEFIAHIERRPRFTTD